MSQSLFSFWGTGDKVRQKEPWQNGCNNIFEPIKGGIMSEDNRGFLPLPKNIPKFCLKLSYPVHGNDKVLVKFNKLHVKKFYSYEIKI